MIKEHDVKTLYPLMHVANVPPQNNNPLANIFDKQLRDCMFTSKHVARQRRDSIFTQRRVGKVAKNDGGCENDPRETM